MTMCVCRWTFLCVSFFLPTEAFGSCGRTFRPRCHCLDSSWRLFQKRSPALRGSPRDVTLPVCARISTIMIIRSKNHLPEVACSSTSLLLYPHTTTTEHHTLQSAQIFTAILADLPQSSQYILQRTKLESSFWIWGGPTWCSSNN